MTQNPRVGKAFAAMKAIGLNEEIVKPVLKNLWRLFDKNWDPIEEDNYRALADAIFEYEESKAAEERDRGEAIANESEPSLKRLRRQPGGQSSTSGWNSSSILGEGSLKRPKLEEYGSETCYRQGRTGPMQFVDQRVEPEPELEVVSPMAHMKNKGKESASPQTCPEQEGAVPLEICRRDRRIESDSASLQVLERHKGKDSPETAVEEKRSPSIFKDKGKEPVSPQNAFRDKISPSEGAASQAVCLKVPKIEPGIVVIPREQIPNQKYNDFIEPKSQDFTDDLPQFVVPIAMIRPIPVPQRIEDPVSTKASSSRNCSAVEVDCQPAQASQSEDAEGEGDWVSDKACKTGKEHEHVNIPKESSVSFEIASSPLGEVKILLSCDSAPGQSGFHVPNLDKVLKMVEDRCIKSYRIVEPRFSVMNLMKELCLCFLELGSGPTDKKAENGRNAIPTLDTLGSSNVANALGPKQNLQNNFNVSLGSSSGSGDFNIPLPQISRHLAMDGLDRHDPITRLNHKVVANSNAERKKKKKEPKDQGRGNSSSLLAVQQHLFGDVRPLHDVSDISKGEEKRRISVVNEFGGDECPPLFYYIRQNIVYQSAYVKFSLARIGDEDCCSSCFGDCLSSSIPCACARESGGEFAYTQEGRVKERFLDECISMLRDPDGHPSRFYCKDCPLERSKNDGLADPCKGHLVRKFIKECWSKCGCNKRCKNRVVQRGITCKLQVFMTPGKKGWGLQSLEGLPKGTFICEYVGEIVTNIELYERNMRSSGKEKHTYPVLLDADWGSEGVLNDEECLCLDATFYGNVARFINHRCFDANMIGIPVEVETPDHHYYHLAFFTTRNIFALEELTWDYGIDFDDHKHPVKAFQCCCGSKFCRDKKCSNRGKSLVLG
ncbi:probable inactive histone-lysine N-methyltransferase SUVR2 [Macadamia integrifolia]|uniref:probable inactive histone-lysine N-methyltransferase SUVR2 n=1 Tax=Macadamia integrifolia TaxID=60698 RepID=UPI001C4EBB97|nr:probable inactive histone-lysine N-methyltransferase SUVR2 [Macadamia integrifolia]XP_042495754.1 probable inactive histone-lysine N-methyltransferase SUVR2 [Macadamia integrifolia]XP_042495755.1 probable inactive histone-lysine N-methyltransferase SUVR2 [Macadamia integrifolia]XP_042495756.1 probable inactive histone-lysine N-methyltransferase SUVR2 [Macadamia integrifolia]XP_042495757.1 probable inactive histone-lysine N-methyltransferase SUVR2 [Macadamia integrifolia]XP_042495758.1 proba